MAKLFTIPNTNAKGLPTTRPSGVVALLPKGSGGTPRLVLSPSAAPLAAPAITAKNTSDVLVYRNAPISVRGQRIVWKAKDSFYGRYPNEGELWQGEVEDEINYNGSYENVSTESRKLNQAFVSATSGFYFEPKIPQTPEGLYTGAAWNTFETCGVPTSVGAQTVLQISANAPNKDDRDYAHARCSFSMHIGVLGFPNVKPGATIGIWCTLQSENYEDAFYKELSTGTTSKTTVSAFAVPYKIISYPIDANIANYSGGVLSAGVILRHDFPTEIQLTNKNEETTTQGWVYFKVPPSRLIAFTIELPMTSATDRTAILNAINIATSSLEVPENNFLYLSRSVSVSLGIDTSKNVMLAP